MKQVFLFLAALLCVSFALPAHAETSIAIVNVEKVLNEVEASKKLNKQRADAREKFLSSLTKQEQALRDEGKALFEKRKDLSEEEFAKQQKTYEAKLLEMRKKTQKKKRAFDEASAKALSKLQDHLADVVKGIADEKKYDLVISNRDVIAGAKSLDITEDTIKAMNDKKVKIPFDVQD